MPVASVIVPDELSLADAWEDTLTGDCSFYRSPDGDPYLHFATDIAASETIIPLVQELLGIARDCSGGPLAVVDIGSGAGALLTRLAHAATDARLIGIDLRARPPGLDPGIEWITGDARQVASDLRGIRGVVVAHEFLDDIPCEAVEADEDGRPRRILVDTDSRELLLGELLDDPADLAWLNEWWPVTRPLVRAEIGRSRDLAWADITGMLDVGAALAIDYGHTRTERVAGTWDGGTLVGYRDGQVVTPIADGSCNLTAHVAIDSLAAAAPRAQSTSFARWSAAPGRADFVSLVQTFT
jgi:SAM-dependent MidA family methyltransferase